MEHVRSIEYLLSQGKGMTVEVFHFPDLKAPPKAPGRSAATVFRRGAHNPEDAKKIRKISYSNKMYGYRLGVIYAKSSSPVHCPNVRPNNG